MHKLMSIAFICLSCFGLGRISNSPDYDKELECSHKVSKELDERMKDPNWKLGMSKLPFDVLYHYILGKNCACIEKDDR